MRPTDHFFTADGLKLHYVEWGKAGGETLFMVHGNRDHARSWDFLIDAVASKSMRFSRFVSLDLRGHGDSEWSPPGRGYLHEDFLFDLMGLVRHLRQESINVVAHSLGGSMALLFAGSLPQRVKKLVLVEAVGPYARSADEVPDILAGRLEGKGSEAQRYVYPNLEAATEALKKKFPMIPAEACAHMARHGTRRDNGGYVWKHDPRLRFRSQSTLSEEQTRAFIGRIRCPNLLVVGSESGFMQSPRAPRIPLFPNSRLIEVAGAGHHVPHERPEELAEIIVPFLEER